jgi:hypothetical protein
MSPFPCEHLNVDSVLKLGKHRKLTDSTDPEEEASVAEIVFGRFELSRSTKRRQLLANRTAVGKSVARKVLKNSKWFEQS